MRLIIFGPQGAGKGTQSKRIAEKYGIPAISTGDIFRWAIGEGSELGRTVGEYVQSGRLVPDELTIAVVTERLSADDCRDGFLLDGFPRNIAQAEALDSILQDLGCTLDAALVIDVPLEVSLERILGRSTTEGRTDDADEEAIRTRLQLYHEQTAPLAEYYRARGLLRPIEGLGTPDDVFARIASVL